MVSSTTSIAAFTALYQVGRCIVQAGCAGEDLWRIAREARAQISKTKQQQVPLTSTAIMGSLLNSLIQPSLWLKDKPFTVMVTSVGELPFSASYGAGEVSFAVACGRASVEQLELRVMHESSVLY